MGDIDALNDGSAIQNGYSPFTAAIPAVINPFADDQEISGWAKDSVYFMAANGIIAGVGDNTFAPKAVTTEQQAAGYAQATREQALTIAVRMVENFGK
ncbi:MAG: S-layer homology domain-containing protein [Clostridia bacterium]|nr:S-layer homology domain-containing protein [Clostridia bacterium]